MRRLWIETLEPRTLLAAVVLSESFKTLSYNATGTFSASVRGDIQQPNDYFNNYSGTLTFSGNVNYLSSALGSGNGAGTGSASGSENCPPDFGKIDSYAYQFAANNAVSLSGLDINLTLNTTSFNYSNSACTGNYAAGTSPYDDTFAGTIDLSAIPYRATFQHSETTHNQYTFRSNATINVSLTPTAATPLDLRPVSLEAVNGFVNLSLAVTGPTLATPSPTTARSAFDLYFATGPNASDVIGAPLYSHPVYWNTAAATVRVELPENIPTNATHLVVIADRNHLLSEANEANNVLATSFVRPGKLVAHAFTAQVTSYQQNSSPLGQDPGIAPGTILSGSLLYDATTRQYGQLALNFPRYSTNPILAVDLQGDAAADTLALTYRHTMPGWQFSQLAYTFNLAGPVGPDHLPIDLAGFIGTFSGQATSSTSSAGFAFQATITSLAKIPIFEALEGTLTLDEETTGDIDIPALFAQQNLQVLPATVAIVQQPAFGSATVDSATGTIRYTPVPNFWGVDSFQYAVTDVFGDRSLPGDVLVNVRDVPEPYRNPAGMFYVDPDDLVVTPLDAVLIITELNATGARPLPPPTGPITAYVDVNGDNFLTPLDVVLLITFLNAVGSGAASPPSEWPSPSGEAEGESDLDVLSQDVAAIWFFWQARDASPAERDRPGLQQD